MRDVTELIDVPEPAWPALEAELRSRPGITILPITEAAGRETLYRLQVTARSRLGALALHTGGVLVDEGWLRVLGGGDNRGLPSLAEANGLPGDERPPASMLVGQDVLGGLFEVNGPDPDGAGRPGAPGEVCWFGPDTLEWEALGVGHGAWLSWIGQGGTAEFYEHLRWPGWENEVRGLPLTHGLTVYPFLWSAEAQDNIAGTTRSPAPLAQILGAQDEFAAKFAE